MLIQRLTLDFHIVSTAESCEPLDTPDNGALLCDTTSLGQFCYFFCKDDYDVPFSVANMFQSGEPFLCRNGSWIPPYPVPDCEGKLEIVHFAYLFICKTD